MIVWLSKNPCQLVCLLLYVLISSLFSHFFFCKHSFFLASAHIAFQWNESAGISSRKIPKASFEGKCSLHIFIHVFIEILEMFRLHWAGDAFLMLATKSEVWSDPALSNGKHFVLSPLIWKIWIRGWGPCYCVSFLLWISWRIVQEIQQIRILIEKIMPLLLLSTSFVSINLCLSACLSACIPRLSLWSLTSVTFSSWFMRLNRGRKSRRKLRRTSNANKLFIR